MQKKKVLNALIHLLKIVARVLILNIPAVIILLGLMAADKLSWISAGISLLAFWGISGIIVFYVFKDLDNFMIYLKKLAQGFEPELPKLHWGIFSSMRLTKTFLSVKNLWSDQFLSDASVLQNLPNPLFMINPNKKIVFSNKSAQSFFGQKALRTSTLTLFFNKPFSTAIESALQEGFQSKTLDLWETKNLQGEKHSFQVKIDRLPAPTQKGAVVVISLFDITPFQLFKTQQADFFANASHELKTPLAIISGCVETLQGSAKGDLEATDKFLTLIGEQTTRMTSLVQNMLKLARLQVDVPLNASNAFSVNDLIQKVVDDLQLRSQTLQKKIILKKAPTLPLFKGNREDLYHVFQNLLDNALKYSAPHSDIHITTSLLPKKSFLCIAFHNVGQPISQQNQSRIFDKFYRVDSDNATSIEGSGLGLGIVQHLVQKHQGHIDLKSSQAHGTTFTVYLPTDV